jgi:hypothetical protein
MLWAYTHTRQCLLMPALPAQRLWRLHLRNHEISQLRFRWESQGAGLDRGFKEAGNMRVEVTGEIQGDTIKVDSLKLLP